jgi:hypothetical protein
LQVVELELMIMEVVVELEVFFKMNFQSEVQKL